MCKIKEKSHHSMVEWYEVKLTEFEAQTTTIQAKKHDNNELVKVVIENRYISTRD